LSLADKLSRQVLRCRRSVADANVDSEGVLEQIGLAGLKVPDGGDQPGESLSDLANVRRACVARLGELTTEGVDLPDEVGVVISQLMDWTLEAGSLVEDLGQ
jgi:hypothetical protein